MNKRSHSFQQLVNHLQFTTMFDRVEDQAPLHDFFHLFATITMEVKRVDTKVLHESYVLKQANYDFEELR